MSSSQERSSASGNAGPHWQDALRSHPRTWQSNRYVYPVLSRRARGISIGINLSPDQVCNFQCVYCQVDRSQPAPDRVVDLAVLRSELDHMLAQVASGDLFLAEPFAGAPSHMRRVSDIAFSGDGEPTASRVFPGAVDAVIEAGTSHHLPADMKIVVLTNATLLDRPAVGDALDRLHGHAGEIWAKLDAGTEEHYRRMNRCPIPLQRIVDNIALAARRWRVLIQSMWLRLDGREPDQAEIAAFCDRLSEITRGAGRLEGIQVYTLARKAAEANVSAIPEDRLRAIAETIAQRTGLTVEVYPSPA